MGWSGEYGGKRLLLVGACFGTFFIVGFEGIEYHFEIMVMLIDALHVVVVAQIEGWTLSDIG